MPISRSLLSGLIVAALVLPIALTIVLAVGRLLQLMHDALGTMILDGVALTGGLIWIVDLAVLVIVLGLEALARHSGGPDNPHDRQSRS